MRSVNNVHLLCHNFHRIANMNVNPILRFTSRSSDRCLESLFHSSRIFQALEFKEFPYKRPTIFNSVDCTTEPVQKYINHVTPCLKELTVDHIIVEPKILLDLINALPNLEAVKFSYLNLRDETRDSEADTGSAKPKKIKRVEISNCSPNIVKLLAALNESDVQEATLRSGIDPNPVILETYRNFLKKQERNLKKLEITGNIF